MAAGAADARPIAEAVEKSGIAFQTGYMWRYDDIANRLQADGRARGVRQADQRGDDVRHQRHRPPRAGPLSVRSARPAAAGFFSWLACHWLDTLFYVTGRAVVGVTARTGVFGAVPTQVEDGGVAIFDLEGGGIATFLGGYWHPALGRRKPLGHPRQPAVGPLGRRPQRNRRRARNPRPAAAVARDGGRVHAARGQDARLRRPEGLLLVQDWLDCIRTGRRDNRNTARGMLATLELIDAIYQSSREGRRIECRIGPCVERMSQPRSHE